jgi:hypothetical protein
MLFFFVECNGVGKLMHQKPASDIWLKPLVNVYLKHPLPAPPLDVFAFRYILAKNAEHKARLYIWEKAFERAM